MEAAHRTVSRAETKKTLLNADIRWKACWYVAYSSGPPGASGRSSDAVKAAIPDKMQARIKYFFPEAGLRSWT